MTNEKTPPQGASNRAVQTDDDFITCGCLARARKEHERAQHVLIDYPRRSRCRGLEIVSGNQICVLSSRFDVRCLVLRAVVAGEHYASCAAVHRG